jgi:hypothetical protein
VITPRIVVNQELPIDDKGNEMENEYTKTDNKFTFRATQGYALRILEYCEKHNMKPSDFIRQTIRDFFWNEDHRFESEHNNE